MGPKDHMQEKSYLMRSLYYPWRERKTLRVQMRLLFMGPRVCIPKRIISCQLRIGGSPNQSMWQCGIFVIIYLMLDIMALKIILLVLTDYIIQFQGFYFEKLCVSLFNYSCHIIILLLKMELAFPPPPLIIYLLGVSSSHPLTVFQIYQLYLGYGAYFFGDDQSAMLNLEALVVNGW